MGDNSNGSAAITSPSTAKKARKLDPDIHPWMRQPEESDLAYAMFVEYRDMERRTLTAFGTTEAHMRKGFTEIQARKLSSIWSWGHRCYQWDHYQGQVDTEELVRYRRAMNNRQRATARAAQNKLAQWVMNLEPERLKPMEAARLLEVVVRIEREAAGANAKEADQAPDQDKPKEQEVTLSEMMGVDPTAEADLAAALARMLR